MGAAESDLTTPLTASSTPTGSAADAVVAGVNASSSSATAATEAAAGAELSEAELELLLGPRRLELYKVIPITIVYTIIFATGIVGNVLTFVVITQNKYMHTATNYYLCNLVLSDLLVLVLGLPLETYSFWSAYPWIFGEAFCVLRTMAAETSTYASILTITAFTVERYVAICHPMRAKTMSSLQRAVKVIVGVWIVSAGCSVPIWIQYGVVYMVNADGRPILESATCNIRYERVHFFEVSSLVFFLAPVTVITILYGLIGLSIRRSALYRANSGDCLQQRCGGGGGGGGDDQNRPEHRRAIQQAKARLSVLKMLGM